MTQRALAKLAIATTVLSLAMAGCGTTSTPSETPASTTSGGAQTGPSKAEIDAAMTTPTQLTFWTWVPNIQAQVDLFQAKYPAIKVKVENVGQGAAHNTKVRTAIQSGTGAPDVVQVRYQDMPSFTLTSSYLDIGPYGASALKGDYVPWVWNQVVKGDKVYGVPQDSGPMGNLYREDLLTAAGVTAPPATWDEYASAAQKVKANGAYISNLASNDSSQILGLMWQAGVKPFAYDGEKNVGINVNNQKAKDVMAYWEKLIKADLISVNPDYTDQWYQALATGKYAGWITAAWGPVFLQGTAASTAGKWRAAELPQWKAGDHITGNWGGSADAVLKGTKSPIAAAQLAIWLNHDKSATTLFTTKQLFFPTTNEMLADPTFLGAKSDFYGGQEVNRKFSEISKTVDTNFEWLPFMDYAASSYNETLGKAIAAKGDLSAGLDAWQAKLTSYAKDQGFTVKS